MVTHCPRCSVELPSDGAPCPDCGSVGPAVEFFLGSSERPTLSEELLDHLRDVTAGEFEIVREIGRGGMARVYLAHEIALDRRVALKVLSPLFTEYPEIVKRFQHEARTAGQLSHPHILPVFAVYQGDGLSFFTMPYVKGASFREIIHDTGPFEVDEAVEFLRQAASGLAYAHERGVVHRDVKPENMMLDEATGRLVLTDFGLAKALGAESLTLPGDMIGTPHYMAPEQCDGDKDIDGRSDQYALALVAYEMLAGEYPFDAEGFRELLMKQISEDPGPLELRRPDVPPHVATAIHKALRKDANDRFPTIEEFGWALTGEEGKDPSVAARRRVSRVSGVYEAKTVWMRDRLVRFHRWQRLKRWRWPAGLTAAAVAVVYFGAAVASGGGPAPAAGTDDGNGVLFAFNDVDPLVEGRWLEPSGPPASLRSQEPAGSSNPAAATETDTQPASRNVRSRPSSRPASESNGNANASRPSSSPAEPPAQARPSPDDGQLDSTPQADGSGAASDGAAPEDGDPTSETSLAGEGADDALARPEAALEVYRQALEREDLDELGRIYGGEVPEADRKMLRQIFDNADNLQVEMRAGEIELQGDRAFVEVDYPMRYVLQRTQRSQDFTLKLRVTLEAGSDGWRIVELQRR